MTTSKSWRDVLPIHPAADLFPRMSPDDLAELAADIKKNGLKNPVVLWRPGYSGDGSKERLRFVLDGINRLDAMERAGIRFLDDQGAPTEFHGARFRTEYEKQQVSYMAIGGRRRGAMSGPRIELKTDPYAYVISANIHRRHLTTDQKRDLIAKLIKATPEKSDRQIATAAKTDHKTVASVRAEQEARGEIPHVSTRTDSKGRQQPARKPSERKSREEIAAYEAGRLLGCLELASDAVQRDFVQSLPAEILAHRDDIGTASNNGEIARKDARIEELEHENRRLQLENIALRSEIEELKAQLLDIPGFLDRTKEAAS